MDKNSVIGFILIAAILFGFTFIQNRQARERMAEQQRLDSIARHEAVLNGEVLPQPQNGSAQPQDIEEGRAPEAKNNSIFKDSTLQAAYTSDSRIIALENELVRVEFNTRGACPYSVLVKDYYNYDSTSLYIFKPEKCNYSLSLYTGEFIQTKDFNFTVESLNDSEAVMRLYFDCGGYIEQKWTLAPGSYMVDNLLTFNGMDGVIPRNVSSFDLDFDITVPRMEKGYKNESQYSKLDYYFEGDKKPVEMGRGRNGSKRIDSKLSWFAFQQQFFSAIMYAPAQFSTGELSINFLSENDPERNLMACSAKMRCELEHGNSFSIPFQFYFGPNHFQTLKSFDKGFEKIIPLGGWLVGWFTKFVIIPLFNFFNRFFSSYGLIILLMTLVIKIVVFPLTYKSYASSAKMQALKPEIEKINARYPKQEDAMKKQQATMDLYKRAGVNMMGGCLPTLLTFPILWAMFRFFPASIELRQQAFLWCKDLSAYDSILDYGTRIPILGDHLSLFALLMALTMWLYSKMTMSGQASASDPSAKSMQFMTLWMMPIMMFFICNNLSAALSYYYLLSQLIAIIQTWAVRKSIDKDAILAKVHASEGKPLPKSKWQIRLEEAQKMQEQQLKQQKKQGRR